MTLHGPTLTRSHSFPWPGPRVPYGRPSHYAARHLAWQARQHAQGLGGGTAAYKAWLGKRRIRKAARAARRAA